MIDGAFLADKTNLMLAAPVLPEVNAASARAFSRQQRRIIWAACRQT